MTPFFNLIMKNYYIQTRLRDRWVRVHLETYNSIDQATLALEKMIDELFFTHREIVTVNDFRIVKAK
jgi:hypothetical protein